MMYSEFIERTGYDENYVTFADYADYIEPAYMRLDIDKDKFCKKFINLYREKVSAAVESAEKLIQRGFFKELKRKNYDKKLV